MFKFEFYSWWEEGGGQIKMMVQGSRAPLQAESSELERIVDGRKERLAREAFRDWDRGVKGSLTRHEATCALLEVFGVKPGQVRPQTRWPWPLISRHV